MIEKQDVARAITRDEFSERYPERSRRLPKSYSVFLETGRNVFMIRELASDVQATLSENLGDETTRAFVGHLHQAVERMRSIGELESVEIFPIEFADQKSNFRMIPYLVSIRAGLLNEFHQYSDHPEFAALSAFIESGYFHELVHYVQYLRLDEPNEITSLMGEFLYDPELNAIRNEYKFSNYSSRGSEFVRTGRISGREGHYVLGWLVAAKLLIAEASDSGLLDVPPSIEEQLGILPGLPQLFAALVQDERDRILARYIRLGEETLGTLSREAGKRIGLLF